MKLKTPRLTLRALKDSDDQDIFTLRSDKRVNEYIDRAAPFSPADCRVFIEKINRAISEGKCYYWALCHPGDELIGTICIWNISDDKLSAELGYELLPDWQGIGLMKEAIPAVIAFCKEQTGLRELWGVTHWKNKASVALLLGNGFRYEPSKKEENADLHFYRLTFQSPREDIAEVRRAG